MLLIFYYLFVPPSVPVCPHAGGVALCELVQHLAMFDFVSVSGTMENRFVNKVEAKSKHHSESLFFSIKARALVDIHVF